MTHDIKTFMFRKTVIAMVFYMKIRKIGTIFIASCLVTGLSLTPAYAVFDENETRGAANMCSIVENQITPRWTQISSLDPYLRSSGKILYPEVTVEAQSSKATITGTMYLEKETSSGRWTSVRTWPIQDTGDAYVAGDYSGTSGTTYRTRVVVYVNGEKAEVTSNECSL